MRKPFARSCFAPIFCTDFCTDFWKVFCTDSWHGFWRGFFARIFVGFFAWILAWIFAQTFCTDFLGCPKPLAGKRQIFSPRTSPKKSPCFGGLLGRCLGGKRVRWRLCQTWPKPKSPRTGGVGAGARLEEVAIPVDLNQDSYRQDQNHEKPRSGEGSRPWTEILSCVPSLWAKWPCRGAKSIFEPDFWVEFWKVNLGGEFLEGEFFWGPLLQKNKQNKKHRPKNSGPKFGRQKFVSQESAPNSGYRGAKSPVQKFVPHSFKLNRKISLKIPSAPWAP